MPKYKRESKKKGYQVELTAKSALNLADLRKTLSILEEQLPRLTDLSFNVVGEVVTQANACKDHTCSGTYDKGPNLPDPGSECPGHSYCEAESCKSHSCTGHVCDAHACETHACSNDNFTGEKLMAFSSSSSKSWNKVVDSLSESGLWEGISLHSEQNLMR